MPTSRLSWVAGSSEGDGGMKRRRRCCLGPRVPFQASAWLMSLYPARLRLAGTTRINTQWNVALEKRNPPGFHSDLSWWKHSKNACHRTLSLTGALKRGKVESAAEVLYLGRYQTQDVSCLIWNATCLGSCVSSQTAPGHDPGVLPEKIVSSSEASDLGPLLCCILLYSVSFQQLSFFYMFCH